MRGYKARLINAQLPIALEQGLERIVNRDIEENGSEQQQIHILTGGKPTPTRKIVTCWLRGDPAVISYVDNALEMAELSMEDINARAMALALDEIELIDQLQSRAEQSRNSTLQQFERWCAVFARRLRGATQDIIDGEFNSIGPDTTAQKNGGHG